MLLYPAHAEGFLPVETQHKRVLWPDEKLAIEDRPGAYQWWYFDATSDDGEWTFVAIFFYGSVFSPWYTGRLQQGDRALPSEHPAVNLALYRKGQTGAYRWAFNEYGGSRAQGDGSRSYELGSSRFERNAHDGGYELSFDEHPGLRFVRPFSLKGRVRFEPERRPTANEGPLVIDEHGQHRWHPVAPRCRVEAEFDAPSLRFRGRGYHDVNHGDAPLHTGFQRWTWCRTHEASRSRIEYDRVFRSGTRSKLSVELSASSHGARKVHDRIEARPMELQRGGWALEEPRILSVGAQALREVQRVESSPFYARYTGQTTEGAPAVAEHLDLPRYESRLMQRMLPFRARRIP